MFRPSIQKTKVLVFIALINLILFYMVSNSVITEKTTNHDQKIKAATDMKVALSKLKKYGKNLDLVISADTSFIHLAGILNIIPNLGPTISTIFPMSVALLDEPWKALAVLGLYIFIQNYQIYLI